jgi:GTPase SAR1 family protein
MHWDPLVFVRHQWTKPFDQFYFFLPQPEKLTEKVLWADGFLLVYSITDVNSFNDVINLKHEIVAMRSNYRPAIFIVGNKSDLICERCVSKEFALQIVQELNCPLYECSASENYEDILQVFHELYNETIKKKKERRLSISPRPLKKAFNKVFGSKTPM